MFNKAGKTVWACGSAFMRFLETALEPVFNERGEVIVTDPSQGAGGGEADPDAGASPAPDGEGGEPDGSQDDGDPSAGSLNAGDTSQSEGEEYGQQAGETPPWHKDPRWVKFQQERKAIEEERASFNAQLKQANEIANFYQNQFNDYLKASRAVGQKPDAAAGRQPGQPGQPDPSQQQTPFTGKMELPPHIKGPGKWETQEDEAAYLDHMTKDLVTNQVPHVAMQAVKHVYDTVMNPMIENMNSMVADLQESFTRQMHPDYDDVIKAANEAIFTLGPDGKVFGVKNPALLSYIRAQKNPYLALYQHGMTIKAPGKIKAGVDSATKKVLKAIGAKPSGPSRPAGSSAPAPAAELDWDTPPQQADKVLAKRGLL